MEQPNKKNIMYFEFRKLVYLILPCVIYKADLLWFESNPEFRPIRIRNYKYYINICLENHQHFLVDLSKFANNTKWQLFLVSNCGQESVVWLNVSRIFHLPSGLLPLKSYLPVSDLARHGQSGIRLIQTLDLRQICGFLQVLWFPPPI